MTRSKTTDLDYIHFLISEYCSFSCCEAERCLHYDSRHPYHDSFRRLLEERTPHHTEALWKDVGPFVSLTGGYLIIDDSTLDKPHSRSISLTGIHWSGNHHKMVQGISLVTLVWTDGISTYPLDFRIYHKDSDGKTKNDHFQDMLRESAVRGLNPDCVLFDSWYGSVDNLRLVRRLGWHFLTRLKKNRQVNPDKLGNKQIHEISIPSGGCVVHLKDYGMVRVFHRDDDGNGVQFWATDILDLEEKTRQTYAGYAFKIEEYHRNLKQYCGVERCQARTQRSQRAHIQMAIRAFIRMEWIRTTRGISMFQQKMETARMAVFSKIQELGGELLRFHEERNTA